MKHSWLSNRRGVGRNGGEEGVENSSKRNKRGLWNKNGVINKSKNGGVGEGGWCGIRVRMSWVEKNRKNR